VKLRVGVIGVGPMGMGHVKHYRALDDCELVAVVDRDPQRRAHAATLGGAQAFSDVAEILDRVDAVSIASPTTTHTAIALQCIEAGIHVLVEKPLAQTEAHARQIVDAAKAKGVVLQVGHIERFNPAFSAAKEVVNDPRYVIADRLSPYSFRSRDIGVVLDMMIHDLDIIFEFIEDEVESFEALGIPVLSPSEDMCDVRLRFKGGAIADVRASRVSMKRMRKFRLFQSDGYVSIDYGQRSISTFRMSEAVRSGKVDPLSVDPSTLADPFSYVFGEMLEVEEHSMESKDALKAELRSFLDACRGLHPPEVSGEEGLRAVRLADQIQVAVGEYLEREAKRAGIDLSK